MKLRSIVFVSALLVSLAFESIAPPNSWAGALNCRLNCRKAKGYLKAEGSHTPLIREEGRESKRESKNETKGFKFLGSFDLFTKALNSSDPVAFFRQEGKSQDWFLEFFTRDEALEFFPTLNPEFVENYYKAGNARFDVNRNETKLKVENWGSQDFEEVVKLADELVKMTDPGSVLLFPGRSGLVLHDAIKGLQEKASDPKTRRNLIRLDISAKSDYFGFLPNILQSQHVKTPEFLTALITPERFDHFMKLLDAKLKEQNLSFEKISGLKVYLVDYLSSGYQVFVFQRILAEIYSRLNLKVPDIHVIDLVQKEKGRDCSSSIWETCFQKMVTSRLPEGLKLECKEALLFMVLPGLARAEEVGEKPVRVEFGFDYMPIRNIDGSQSLLPIKRELIVLLALPYQSLIMGSNLHYKMTGASSKMSWGKYYPAVIWRPEYEAYRTDPASKEAEELEAQLKQFVLKD